MYANICLIWKYWPLLMWHVVASLFKNLDRSTKKTHVGMIWQQHSLNNRILCDSKPKTTSKELKRLCPDLAAASSFPKPLHESWALGKNKGESNARSIHKLQWKVPSLTLGLLADVPWGKCGGDTCPGNGGTCRETTSVRLVFCESRVSHVSSVVTLFGW